MKMGTIFVVTCATWNILGYFGLHMGYFEVTFYRICINELGETLDQFILQNWSRFQYDCKTSLDKTKIDPKRLLEIHSSINPSIKFTMKTGSKELPFLDILIKRNNSKIWMDIYFKPTDTRRCLQFSSSHPNHCKKNTIY